MNISNPLYSMMEDDEMVEEFYPGEKRMALLPMADGNDDFIAFTIIECDMGDVTILYSDGSDLIEKSMTVEELTRLMSDD
jgi:hypothetical protein